MKSKAADIFFQLALSFCFLLVLTGGCFLIGWKELKSIRTLHGFLILGLALAASLTAWLRYRQDPAIFFDLEPARTLRAWTLLPAWQGIALLSIIYACVQIFQQILSHWAMETALYDFGIIDQALWNTAHGHFLIESVRGGYTVFAERFKLMLALLAPVYWHNSNPMILFMVTTSVISTSIIAVYLIARQVTQSHITALVFAVCVTFYLPFRNGIHFLFHTQTLADPLLLFGFFGILTKRFWLSMPCFILAMMCKESVIIDVLGISFFLLYRRVKAGWWVGLLACMMIALLVFVVEPHFRPPHPVMDKWSFYALFKNPLDLTLWARLFEPNPLVFLILIFGPFLLLPLACKGWALLLGPSLAFRLLSLWPGFRLITAHYTSGMNALIFISAIYGWSIVKHQVWGRILLLFSALVFSGTSQWFKIDRYLWEISNPAKQKIVQILDSIPSEYSVLTNERPSAHLTHRHYLFVFFSMMAHAPYENKARQPDLIVVDEERIQDPERREVERFMGQGYRRIFHYEFITIYERPTRGGVVPRQLIEHWNGIRESKTVAYRSVVWRIYHGFLSAAFVAFSFILATQTTSKSYNHA